MIREVSDKKYGLVQPDGSWTGLVGEVQRGASDQCFWGFLKKCLSMLTNTDFKFNFSLQVQMKYINIKNND